MDMNEKTPDSMELLSEKEKDIFLSLSFHKSDEMVARLATKYSTTPDEIRKEHRKTTRKVSRMRIAKYKAIADTERLRIIEPIDAVFCDDMAFRVFEAYGKKNAVLVSYSGTDNRVEIPAFVTQSDEVIPVTHIGKCAFCNYPHLEEVIVSDQLRSIGNRAFSGCSHLKRFTWHAFSNGVPDDPNASVFPPFLYQIGDLAFYRTGLTHVVIASSFVEIGYMAFAHTESLLTVEFTSSGKLRMDAFAFEKSGIKFFRAPNTRLESVPEGCFSRCYGLIDVFVPLSTVNDYAFDCCVSLRRLHPSTLIQFAGEHAFRFCEDLRENALDYGILDLNNPSISFPADDVLLKLKPEGEFRGCPTRLSGTFVYDRYGGTFYADEETTGREWFGELRCIADSRYKMLLPLIEWLSNDDIPVTLTGRCLDNDCFLVEKIQSPDSDRQQVIDKHIAQRSKDQLTGVLFRDENFSAEDFLLLKEILVMKEKGGAV